MHHRTRTCLLQSHQSLEPGKQGVRFKSQLGCNDQSATVCHVTHHTRGGLFLGSSLQTACRTYLGWASGGKSEATLLLAAADSQRLACKGFRLQADYQENSQSAGTGVFVAGARWMAAASATASL